MELRGSHGKSAGKILTRNFGTKDLHTLKVYAGLGGYKALEKALTMKPSELIDEVKASGLRGRGGAGFATGVKWSFVPAAHPGPKYVVVNCDESEPGSAKDRYLMENSPHMLVEGILIACFAIGAHQAWIYIRGEYDRPYQRLVDAITEARSKGHIGSDPFGSGYALDIQIYRGHGAYICGEETALLESLEGKRAQPRSRPPFPAVKGAWGMPTLLNNAETLATVPWIVANGGAEYAKFGTEKNKGTRMFTVSGNVQRPGNYEIEIGMTLRSLIFDLAGGPPAGHKVKAVWPGGSSARVLTEAQLDTTTDIESLAAADSMAGSGGCIVMDDSHCIVRGAYRLLLFYAKESCGKCTPCRVGGNWAVRTYEKILAGHGSQQDLDLLDRVQAMLQDGRCLCVLGDSAGNVIVSTMRKFRAEYEEHALRNECSAERKPVHA